MVMPQSAPALVAAAPAPAPVVVRNPVMYTMQLGCVGLDRKDVFSKSDPFILLSAKRSPGGIASSYHTQNGSHGNTMMNADWVVVHKTETIMNNQKPVFQPFQIDLNVLCNGNMDQPFLIEVYDWDANTKHDFIGSVQTTIRECQILREMHLRNPHRYSLITKVAGTLNVLRLEPAGPVGAAPPGAATVVHAGAPPPTTVHVTMQGGPAGTAYPPTGF